VLLVIEPIWLVTETDDGVDNTRPEDPELVMILAGSIALVGVSVDEGKELELTVPEDELAELADKSVLVEDSVAVANDVELLLLVIGRDAVLLVLLVDG
jgi:hypothetical protein